MGKRNKRPRIGGDGKGGKCAYCRRTMESTQSPSRVAATRDHIIPKSIGGTYRVWCCRTCNNLKADMKPDEWAQYMCDNPEWWKKPMRETFADRLAFARTLPR